MAATGASLLGVSPTYRRCLSSYPGGARQNSIFSRSSRRSAVTSAEQVSTSTASTTSKTVFSFDENGRFQKKNKETEEFMKTMVNPYGNLEEVEEERRKSLNDYFEEAKSFIRTVGSGPPRWFSPLECGAPAPDSPLLLFLPGIDGTGLGLTMHHQTLGKIFDMWCLHIPVMDHTPFTELVKLVERTVRSENYRSPNRPIYLVGESIGGCIALDVAARNPDIDLVLILANPATSFSKSRLQHLVPLLEVMPDEFLIGFPHMLSVVAGGDHLRMAMDNVVKRLPLQQMIGKLTKDLVAMASYLLVHFGFLPRETLLWKLRMLKFASSSACSRLHAVKAQTLILSSGKDEFLPSHGEAERLYHALQNCEIRRFDENGHFLFLEDDVNLVTVIKGASFYRRGKYHDYASDYMPPTQLEFKKIYDSYRVFLAATSPVMLSTLENGKVVRSLAGIPSEGPVLFVGYHMLLGLELAPMIFRILTERNILVRGIAHPLMFIKLREGRLPELQSYDTYRLMGAVPVSATNLYRLLSSKSHVLLYPGGVREALHRKGEEYKLFWPEHPEFVRMAARFGAKIVPFGVVGEDDIGELIFDYNDQVKIPYLKAFIEELTNEATKLRAAEMSEVGNQDIHLPGILPKLPGRFYYYFGKPIETAGRKQELRDREKAHELYLQVKSEVESCIAFLKEKRESDPYRSSVTRLLYQANHGFTSEIPTFKL